ncbi:hypothetical protein KEM60_00260 [Austwickia sp. TVS 96-490-7B]|uniref:hypothetical protein n=1 Tax=Austwickia sp. TVS 96-490-7B TaxID=2830843 RepID=UPI001C57BC4A|nr:hypothetical protein [Austwickia sp. TVS 96-490-7B]MBW3084077.1 hypothetical protein [Austwickia sp. TVS 96-490-7B]
MHLIIAAGKKDLLSYRRRSGIVIAGMFVLVVPILAVVTGMQKISSQESVAAILFYAIYGSLYAAITTVMMTVRFWEERASRTLETYLSLPWGVRSGFLGKLAFPVTAAAVVSLAANLMITFTLALISRAWGTWLLLGILVQILLVAISLSVGVLIGYAMWMLSENAAKLVQVSILGVAGFGFAGLFTGGVPNISTALGTLGGLAVILGGAAGIAFVKLDVERIVLNES